MPNLAWLAVLFVALILKIPSPQWLAFSYLFVLSLFFFPRHYVVKKQIVSPLLPPRKKYWRPMFGYGFPLVLSSIPSTLNLRLDQMLMVTMLPAKTVGYYVVAVAWSAALSPLINAIGMVLFPYTANARTLEHKTIQLKRGIHATIIVAISMSLLVVALTPVAIPFLFGKAFSPAIPAAYILVAAGFFLSLKRVLQEGIRGLGVTKLILWGESAGLIITAVLLFATLPLWGIMGAAITSLVAYGCITAFYLWRVSLIASCGLSELLLPDKAEWELVKARFNEHMKSFGK